MSEKKRELTPRQQEVLRALCRWLDEHGYPPSVRELGEALGLSSTRTIHDHLGALEQKGYIRRHHDRSRALEVLAGLSSDTDFDLSEPDDARDVAGATGRHALGIGRAASFVRPLSRAQRPVPVVPIVGEVAAGVPILADEQRDGELHLDALLASDPNMFLLRVRGTSMIDAHICDGDLVLIRPQPIARDGDAVVVLIDDEVTLKHFYRREGCIELRPANPTMASILVTPEMGEVRILGLLSGVIRRC